MSRGWMACGQRARAPPTATGPWSFLAAVLSAWKRSLPPGDERPPLPVHEPVGVWLVGARGAVATTAVAGAAALRAGLAAPTGLVTALPAFLEIGLPDVDDLVFGGHELVETPLV